MRVTRRGDHSSRSRIAPGLQQPTRGSERLALANATHTGRASPPLLFGLAPRGVFRAPDVAIRAVGSYPTFSPLPNPSTAPLERPQDKCARPKEAGFRFCRKPAAEVQAALAVYFLWHFPWPLQDPEKLPAAASKGVPATAPWRYQARCPTLASRRGTASCARCANQVWSPDFPPAPVHCTGTSDHPAHPLL
jgi:hypothetical protein